MNIILFDPGDNDFITFDWNDVLPDSVTLSAVTHTVPSPLSKSNETTNTAEGLSQIKVTGAVHGALYMVEAAATLSNGAVLNKQWPIRGWNS